MAENNSVAVVSAAASRGARFARSSRGNAVAEYAVLLGVLVGGGVLAYCSIGPAIKQSLGELTAVGGADAHHAPARVARGDWRPSQPIPAEATAPRPSPPSPLAGWYTTLATGIALWYLLHRRRASKRRPGDEDAALQGISERQRACLFEKRQQILGILSHDTTILFGSSIEVRHLMSRKLVAVEPGTPAEEVAEMMQGRRIRHLLVCASGGRLLGIVSDRDLRYRPGQSAADLMTIDPIAVTGDTPIGPAITMMLDRHISCLPVIEEGVPIGILTTTDLMMSLQCTLQVLAKLATELRVPLETAAGTSPTTISACAASAPPELPEAAPMA